MQAVILAGGKGTRLNELTKNLPKPLVKVGGIPIIEHQLRLLKKHDIREVIVTTNFEYGKLQEFLKDGSQWGMKIKVIVEKMAMGTAGYFPELTSVLQEQFLILYGDVMMDLDLQRLIQFHEENEAEACLVVHPNDHPYDSDLVKTDAKNRVLAFLRKPHADDLIYQNLVNAGLYLFRRSLINEIPKQVASDFGRDIFPKLVQHRRVFAYRTSEYLKDMGTPKRLQQVETDLKAGVIATKNLTQKQRAIFLDRDGVLNIDKGLIHRKEDLVLYDFTINAIKKINSSPYLTIVVTNQSVVARNLCTIEELEDIHRKLDTELGVEGAKLDALYYCPYHPDKGYPEENPVYKKEHSWRKPNPGMLLQASEDFNIDLGKSYLIGDRSSDIEAGKRAGVTSIGVLTGDGLKSGETLPDYTFENLKEAVDFILESRSI